MADFTARVPFEPQKPHQLHDQALKPAAPPAGINRYLGLVVGFAVGLGFVALAFETRASWDSHRDWVVPVTMPLWVAGGLVLANLVLRRAWLAAGPAMGLLVVALLLTAGDWARAASTEGGDGLRDALTIATAIVLGLLLAYVIPAYVWVEATATRK